MVELEHIRGDTFRLLLNVKNSDGAPVDLTGASCRFSVRDDVDGELRVSEAMEGVSISVGVGQILLTCSPELMELEPGQYVFDVEVTYSDGTRQTLVLGRLVVKGDVST